MMEITVKVTKELFRFESYQQWVNKATSWYQNSGATTLNSLAIAKDGSILRDGWAFETAQINDNYPVIVYSLY